VDNRYEIRVRGHLSPAVAASFEGLETQLEPAETVLYGQLKDESTLYGILDRMQALGLELVEVRRLVGGALPIETRSQEERNGT
jgi:hypothetical protein